MKRLFLLLAVVFPWTQHAVASGYHPPFDKAVAEAELIVVGEVTEAWCPKVVSATKTAPARGRVYRMEVRKVYKGSLRQGEAVVFTDPHHRSTASYRVAESGLNLTFLVKLELSAFERRRYDYGVEELYRPIRNLSKDSVFGPDALDGWLYLLDHFVAREPGDRLEAYRNILKKHENRNVLHYAVTHFPGDLAPADITLFKQVAADRASDAYVAGYAVERLAKAGARFDVELLRKLLEDGSVYMRDQLLSMVDRSNVAGVQDLLFGFLIQDGPEAEQKLIETLARHAPAFLRKQLERHELQPWKLIPCLRELGINGSAVGKSDFPAKILSANPYTLRFVGEVVGGNEFWGVIAMGEPEGHREWEPLFPLFSSTLKGQDTPIRRLVVALMRTFGKKVVRSGETYRVVETERPMPCPVGLTLSTEKKRYRLDEPVSVKVTETARADGTWMAMKGSLGWHVERPDHSATMTGGFFHEFKDVDLPREEFREGRKAEVRVTEVNLTSYFNVPGNYRLSAKKLYPHDGGSHGIDAWTGVAFSGTIEIEIVE
jgi:hypothetical protein